MMTFGARPVQLGLEQDLAGASAHRGCSGPQRLWGLQSQLEDDGADGLVEIISAGGAVCAAAPRRRAPSRPQNNYG